MQMCREFCRLSVEALRIQSRINKKEFLDEAHPPITSKSGETLL